MLNLPENIDERLKKQINFIVEIDKAKGIFRRNLIADGSRNENDAEHMWHMAMSAFILSEYAEKGTDIGKVIKMALVHDLVEIYAGDTFAYDAEGNKDKAERENLAADRLFSVLPTEQGREIRCLWEEFDAEETREAKFAAAIDRINPMLENFLTNGHTWKLGNVTKAQVLDRASPVKAFPKLYELYLFVINYGVEKGFISEN